VSMKTRIMTAVLTILALAGAGVGVGVAASSSSNNPPAAGATPPFAHGAGMMGSGFGPGAMMSGGFGFGPGGMMGLGSGAISSSAAGAMIGAASTMMGGSGAMGMDFSDEFGFLIWMIPHHEEAITTARFVVARTKRPELKALAENIIQTQTVQVAQMRKWLAVWYPGRDTYVDYKLMMQDRLLSKLSGDTLDRTFLEEMVPHHWWAVWASQKLVAQGLYQHQELVPFATVGIRNAQAAQILTMLGMLSRWFGVSPMQEMARIHHA